VPLNQNFWRLALKFILLLHASHSVVYKLLWKLLISFRFSSDIWISAIIFTSFFCGTWFWTQGLHLEPVHHPFFCGGIFQDRVSQTVCLGWLQIVILLISTSWVARITGMNYWCLAIYFLLTILSWITYHSISYLKIWSHRPKRSHLPHSLWVQNRFLLYCSNVTTFSF
jgi:hypothetical protein